MFLDASAIVAILAREEGADALIARIEAVATPILVSPLVRYAAALLEFDGAVSGDYDLRTY